MVDSVQLAFLLGMVVGGFVVIVGFLTPESALMCFKLKVRKKIKK